MEERQSGALKPEYYRKPKTGDWHGRMDGPGPEHLRWHQHVRLVDLTVDDLAGRQNTVAILGFACDEGVKRNQGRVGASRSPTVMRTVLSNLPVSGPALGIIDVGDIVCHDGNMEEAQRQLSHTVTGLLRHAIFPLVIGGGHEVTFANFMGVRGFVDGTTRGESIACINFDAHFDNRQVRGIATSGTGFSQIEQAETRAGNIFQYLAIGIQRPSNTAALFREAERSNTQYILKDDFTPDNKKQVLHRIETFLDKRQYIYLTIDMDVFAAAFAPGVSAPAYNGIFPDSLFFDCLALVVSSGKLVSLDIAELNPGFDIDNRTARLEADIIYWMVERLGG